MQHVRERLREARDSLQAYAQRRFESCRGPVTAAYTLGQLLLVCAAGYVCGAVFILIAVRAQVCTVCRKNIFHQ